MPPHVPGRGVVGHYFDRCISDAHFPSENTAFDSRFVLIQYVGLKTRSSRKWDASQSES